LNSASWDVSASEGLRRVRRMSRGCRVAGGVPVGLRCRHATAEARWVWRKVPRSGERLRRLASVTEVREEAVEAGFLKPTMRTTTAT
jgi:hypothetical protein